MQDNINIFHNAQENYYLIQPGEYKCKIHFAIEHIEDSNKTIEFFTRYVDNGEEKNISVKYIFSEKSKGRTLNELLELLCGFNSILNFDYEFINKLLNDFTFLVECCNSLRGYECILKVEFKSKNNGQCYKSIRLKPIVN